MVDQNEDTAPPVPGNAEAGATAPQVPRPYVVPAPSPITYPRPRSSVPLLVGLGVLLISLLLIAAFVLLPFLGLLTGSDPWTDNGNGGTNSVQRSAGNYSVSYSWSFQGTTWTMTETVPGSTYDHYRNQPKTYDYASYVTKDDPIVTEIAKELKDTAQNHSYDLAQFVLSFVQNVPYATDQASTGLINYPRYPDETLVDQVGDCKDHSTLYVSLMEAQPIGTGMVLLELTNPGSDGHMAAGLEATNLPGTYFVYHGHDYYYCETTSPGWQIGEVPSEVNGYRVTILPG